MTSRYDEHLCIRTPRLRLRCWRDDDLDAFASMRADPMSMRDYGVTADRADSARKLKLYQNCFREHGFSRWLIEDQTGQFVGYTGIMPWRGEDHPLGDHDEIGWRLTPNSWGKGYATEASGAALADGISRLGLTNTLAYTSPTNTASQAVMRRLGMGRDASLDFIYDHAYVGPWTGLVWRAPQTVEVDFEYQTL